MVSLSTSQSMWHFFVSKVIWGCVCMYVSLFVSTGSWLCLSVCESVICIFKVIWVQIYHIFIKGQDDHHHILAGCWAACADPIPDNLVVMAAVSFPRFARAAERWVVLDQREEWTPTRQRTTVGYSVARPISVGYPGVGCLIFTFFE